MGQSIPNSLQMPGSLRPEKINELSTNLVKSSSNYFNFNLIDAVARNNVLNALKSIEFGSLIIQEQNENHYFGVPGQEPCAKVIVNDKKAFRKFAFGGNVGGAEGFILSYWDTPNLLKVTQLLAKNISVLSKIDTSKSLSERVTSSVAHFLNLNSIDGSKRNISAHYDLGNDFFSTFLDETMMYSSAIFEDSDQSLFDASINKLKRICEKLQLTEDDHLLEIGTGWGGMAIYAAKEFGCKVTTTTISQEQYNFTMKKVELLGLSDQVTVLLKDYRLLEGSYDKLVSIEMIEAVGKEHYKTYFEKCSSLLKNNGLMLIQAITIPDQRYSASLKTVDFIQKYIFPGGRLPSNHIIADNVAQYTDLQVVDHHDIGQDYAKTLAHWKVSFLENIQQIKQQGFDDTFCRMWEYYLCYCEGGFSERAISTVQYLMAKPQASFSLNDR